MKWILQIKIELYLKISNSQSSIILKKKKKKKGEKAYRIIQI